MADKLENEEFGAVTTATEPATQMPVLTSGDLFEVITVGMGDAVRPREKKSPDGRLTYTSGTLLRVRAADGSVRTEKTASVHVIDPPKTGEPFQLGTMYRAAGTVWVQPYESNGRVALSITVERLEVLR